MLLINMRYHVMVFLSRMDLTSLALSSFGAATYIRLAMVVQNLSFNINVT